jgi:hypothetical protein
MNRYYILITLIFLVSSCGKRVIVQEVPVVTEHTTVQHRTDIVRDTLMMRDSIYHYVKGDTVVIERWHHVIDVNKMVVTDTVRGRLKSKGRNLTLARRLSGWTCDMMAD